MTYTYIGESRHITNGAAQIARAATVIRTVVQGQRSTLQVLGPAEADLVEAEIDTLHAAMQILKKLHEKRSQEAKTAAEEEKAFRARAATLRIEAARIFDSWRLGVAGWLPLVLWGEYDCVQQELQYGTLATSWERYCNAARDEFVDHVGWCAAGGQDGVADLMQERREKLCALAARECQDFDVLVQQVTAALAVRQ